MNNDGNGYVPYYRGVAIESFDLVRTSQAIICPELNAKLKWAAE